MNSFPKVSVEASAAASDIDALLAALRPKLHRYCARMTGSVIDGEDVLQDALIKAMEAFAAASPIANPEGWLFKIAHNTALDFLRRRNRQAALQSAEEVDLVADQLDDVTRRQIAATSLRTFMRLPVGRRSSVILADVLGCSLREVCEIMDLSLPAAKAALHRGRSQLREIAEEPEDAPVPKLSDADRIRLGAYIAHFNARDFDAIRAMIADDVKLELVNKSRMNGKTEVSRYFGNYSDAGDWHLVPGLVEGRPAILVFDPSEVKAFSSEVDTGSHSNQAYADCVDLSAVENASKQKANAKPKYFMLLGWSADKVATIRDFRYAPYVIEGADYRFAPAEAIRSKSR